jgi:hypothetical protein
MTTEKESTSLSGTAKPMTEKPSEIKGAFCVSPEVLQKIVLLFEDLHRRYSSAIDPILEELLKSPRADVKLDNNPEE